jgi:hypothetical protein
MGLGLARRQVQRPYHPRTVGREDISFGPDSMQEEGFTHSPQKGTMAVGFPFNNPQAVVPAPP